MAIQALIYFSGIVQGVGFRYTVHQYATQLGLKGWVRNCPDGRVEIHIEGEKAAIEQLCEKLKEHFEGNIKDCIITFSKASAEFNTFTIRQ